MVMMLAKWVSASEWLNWFGGRTTHHYVLLDDSYSMGEALEEGDRKGKPPDPVLGTDSLVQHHVQNEALYKVRFVKCVVQAQRHANVG